LRNTAPTIQATGRVYPKKVVHFERLLRDSQGSFAGSEEGGLMLARRSRTSWKLTQTNVNAVPLICLEADVPRWFVAKF